MLVSVNVETGEVTTDESYVSIPGGERPQVITVYAVDLWKRVTDDEADQIEAAMASQSARVRNVFRSANTYKSDDEFWPLLVSTAETLFGHERAAEILAPSI